MICHRCRIRPCEFICKKCKSSLCFQCDEFVHSSLKRSHKREKINSSNIINSPSSEKNTNYETNINFFPNRIMSLEKENDKENEIIDNIKYNKDFNLYNGLYTPKQLKNFHGSLTPEKLYYTYKRGFNTDKENSMKNLYEMTSNYNGGNNTKGIVSYRNKPNNIITQPINTNIPNVSSRYINQIKNIYEQERSGLITKINHLTQELDETKKNLSERLDYLHKHLYEIENKHKIELNEAKNNNGIQTKRLEEEKNLKIDKLQNIIKSQNDTINDLKTKIKNLENSMNERESIYHKKNRDVDNIINEKESLENYYKNEIEQIKKRHTEEKASLISEYEKVINQISKELDINKKNYMDSLNEIKEREDMIQNVIKKAQNEKEQMDYTIMKLKEQNNRDQQNLMNLNSELKNENEFKSEQIEQLKNELKNRSEANEKMKLKVKKMKKQNSEMKLNNTKLNNVVKNKFSKKF